MGSLSYKTYENHFIGFLWVYFVFIMIIFNLRGISSRLTDLRYIILITLS